VKYFILDDTSIETRWRSLILFGKNSATYKFAFAKSLLELIDQEKTVITLEELAEPFSRHIINHLKSQDKQGSSNSSYFLNACRSHLKNEITDEELYNITVKKGFVNVVDAFQNVAGGTIENRFYEKDYKGRSKKLVITDDLLSLKSNYHYYGLNDEVESRWCLVEIG
jgi:hypothetical protein